MTDATLPIEDQPIPFKAETQQLLNILIHSLYTEREIFLRELISNASDALARLDFVMLTDRDVRDPDLPPQIRIRTDKDAGLLIVEDTGVGMTIDELAENLGTIAHSGAQSFVDAARSADQNLSEIIGQFGVGFYAAFMVADSIQVVSQSYKQNFRPAAWQATGEDTYTLADGDREKRGTEVRITLKEDAREFLDETRLRQVIKRHSDFIQYPIYINDSEEPVNRQTALWRLSPREVEDAAYGEFYKQLTLDFTDPLAHAHMVVDAPVQMYALLFISSDPRNLVFSPRKEPGLKLYARKVLIQEFCNDLLPLYFTFVQGVVDSEDLPLNVSRETVQSSQVMTRLKRLVTGKVLEMLTMMVEAEPEKYRKFWDTYGGLLKEGVAIEQDGPEKLFPLLRFHTDQDPTGWSSLADYIGRAKPEQKEIYYFLGDDPSAVRFSPHMDAFRAAEIEVLVLSDPVDPFMLMQLKEFQEHLLVNVAEAELPEDEAETPDDGDETSALDPADLADLIVRFKSLLGERVSNVRTSTRMSASPARLVDAEGAPDQSVQRVYKLMDKDFVLPKKVLELNPKHPIMVRLATLHSADPRFDLAAEQIFENTLLVEGLHPDPVSMVGRIQELIASALGDAEES